MGRRAAPRFDAQRDVSERAESRKGALATQAQIDDGLRIPGPGPGAGRPGLMNRAAGKVRKLGDVAPHVGPLRIELPPLGYGIEDPEIRCRVGAGACDP